MEWDEICRKAISYFEDNEDELRDAINEGEIDGIGEYHRMEDLEDLYGHDDPLDIMKLALKSDDSYGYEFDLDRDYFIINDDGSLTSTDDDGDPLDYLDSDLIQRIYEKRDYIDLPKYIEKLFNAVNDDDDDEDEEDEV